MVRGKKEGERHNDMVRGKKDMVTITITIW